MDILAELQTFKDNYAKLEADYKASTELAEAASKEIETLKADVAAKDTANTEQTATLASLTAELESIKLALSNFKAEQKTAEQLAIELVAKQGVAPIKVEAAPETAMTKQEALDRYHELLQANNSYEAAAFYKANKSHFKK